MNEENEQIPQQPIESTQPTEPVVVPSRKAYNPTGDTKGLKGTLENLPQEVKDDMENFMREVNPYASRKYMKEKYGGAYPKLKELSATAFTQYFKRHNVKIIKELALQKETISPNPEMLQVINAITDPDIGLDDKRNALTSLFNACRARSELLEARQTNFIDPQYEALILANRKEQRAIIEKVAILNEQLSRESDKDFLQELEDFTQVLLSSVINTYKLTHTDQANFSLFTSTLSENLSLALKSYRRAKENVKSSVK